MNFVYHRDRVYASTRGHAIAFKKGVPVHVPPEMHDEVVNIGAVPESEMPETLKPASNEPQDAAERQKAIFAALEVIVVRNRRDDFTAGNSPHAKALSAELGWPVDARERDLMWEKFQQVGKE